MKDYTIPEAGQNASGKAAERSDDGGQTRLEDTFIGRYLAKDGETVEEARKRIRQEEHRRRHGSL